MVDTFRHLGLARWPFTVVPDPRQCTFMADRQRLRDDVKALLRNLSRRDVSSIQLFWAWFGAGKTHTLYYLANQARAAAGDGASNALHTVYAEFPKSARGFLDLYRAFAASLDLDVLIDAYLEVCTCQNGQQFQRELEFSSPDLYSALRVLVMGEQANQIAALRWLRGEPLPAAQLRAIGASQPVRGADSAVRILIALVRMFGLAAQAQGRPGSVVVWMVDEFQRVATTSRRALDEINTGLHSTFNACPNGLALLLSFSGRPDKTLPSWLGRELRDRIGRTKVIILPPMLFDEALVFVRELLEQYRPPDFTEPSPYYPFADEACEAIIREVETRGEIRPRAVMQAFNAVLEEADARIEAGQMQIISPQFAQRALAERVSFDESEGA